MTEGETFVWGDYTGEMWENTGPFWDYNGDGGPDFDCNDNEVPINPGAAEQCDEADVDENCDLKIDDEDPDAEGMVRWFGDGDNDSFGNPTTSVEACDQPDGFVDNEDDCDDTVSSSTLQRRGLCG